MVIANDHYQSTGIVCLSVIRGVQRVAHKRSISFNFVNTFILVVSDVFWVNCQSACLPLLQRLYCICFVL